MHCGCQGYKAGSKIIKVKENFNINLKGIITVIYQKVSIKVYIKSTADMTNIAGP